MGELYKLDFPNGKSYIGITTKNAAERFKGHRRGARSQKKCALLARAWAKYGEPTLITLAVLEEDDLPAAEIRAIKAYGTLHPGGYNMLEGGQISPMKDPEIAARVGRKLKGRKGSAHMAGKKLSDETKAKMSESHKKYWEGRTMSEEHKHALSKANKGRKMTESQKEILLLSHKGKETSAETKEKISKALKGRGRSDEAKRNMSEAARNRWAKQRTENV